MATLAQLDARLSAIVLRIERGVERAVTEIGESVGEVLVPATPVLTGFARGNWRPSLNNPSTRPTTFLDPSGAATISRIFSVARSYKIGDTLYIVNRVPYIGS